MKEDVPNLFSFQLYIFHGTCYLKDRHFFAFAVFMDRQGFHEEFFFFLLSFHSYATES